MPRCLCVTRKSTERGRVEADQKEIKKDSQIAHNYLHREEEEEVEQKVENNYIHCTAWGNKRLNHILVRSY